MTNELYKEIDRLKAVNAELLEACKSILQDYGYDSSIRRQMEDVIAKAEGRD